MSKVWNEFNLQFYIDNEIEESITLDYKAAGSLEKSDKKRFELTKDVSAMANSAGGLIIYGLREHPVDRHKVDKIDPINRTEITKEWLEHNINNIRPRIDGIIIHPVNLSTGKNDVAYVVEVPQSHTAHQATDHRYYKRYNFESISMPDHEVRDVMNRLLFPNISVEFTYQIMTKETGNHEYRLIPILRNLGEQVVNHFKIIITTHRLLRNKHQNLRTTNVKVFQTADEKYILHYHSNEVFFPKEERDLSYEFQYRYFIDSSAFVGLRSLTENERKFYWTLYADNMPPKTGEFSISDFQEFGNM